MGECLREVADLPPWPGVEVQETDVGAEDAAARPPLTAYAFQSDRMTPAMRAARASRVVVLQQGTHPRQRFCQVRVGGRGAEALRIPLVLLSTASTGLLTTSALTAAGLSTGLLLGASASITLVSTKPARSVSAQSRSASWARPSAVWAAAR
jgi:hypothetical protein